MQGLSKSKELEDILIKHQIMVCWRQCAVPLFQVLGFYKGVKATCYWDVKDLLGASLMSLL